ncbi:MAG TPA: hypothetical protein VIP28_02055 [Nocardioides sp.]
MTDAPTLGEAIRRLADITVQLTDITQQLRTDFVRKETHNIQLDLLRVEIKDVRDDVDGFKKKNDTDQAWRRTVSLALAGTFIAALVSIVTTVISMIAR